MAVANGAGAARDGHLHAARRRIHPHRVVVAVVPSRPPADVPVPACAVFVGGGVWVWGCVCSGESEARCECVGVERRQRGERERERERAAENQRSHEQRCTRECVSTARHGCVCVCARAPRYNKGCSGVRLGGRRNAHPERSRWKLLLVYVPDMQRRVGRDRLPACATTQQTSAFEMARTPHIHELQTT